MRQPVSAPQNIFFNGQNVDDNNLTLEQNYNNAIQAGIIGNHFGSGVLPNSLTKNILFDTNNTVGLLDGKAINVQTQPSDNNFGNQLSITLTNSLVAGKRTIKLLIVGLDFENNLQYDRITFNKNETQTTSKHYKSILTIFLNDFYGASTQSLNLGGRIVISEANALTLSRDSIMISQDIQPNIFFRDFFVSGSSTLYNALVAALPSYNISTLNINIGYSQLQNITENDVSSQVAQKFLADTNNIQKITLLMSVANSSAPSNLVWTGDILVSIYSLQSTVSCPSDITPQLAIEFDPSNIPLAQLSINYNEMLASGVKLDGTPQPVDFIFSNTPVGTGILIKPGNYYIVAVKRAGSDDTCEIQFAIGKNANANIRETLFNGSVWTDIPEQSLWFQVWTDAAKVSDGQAYDNGKGIIVPKTNENPLTGLTQDYSLNQIQFLRNDLYSALLQAITQDSVQIQDERTGEPVYTEQQFVPSISLLNSAGLANIQNVSDPLIIGTITDQNIKNISPLNSTLLASFHEAGFVNNQIVIKVITDTTDGYRYDQNIIELVSDLVSSELNGAQIIPNTNNPNFYYRVSDAEFITLTYGDLNGDGLVDTNDLQLAQQMLGQNLNVIPTYDQYIFNTSIFDTSLGLAYQVVNKNDSTVIASGSDGYLTVNPLNGALANFNSASANFNSILNLDNYNLVITSSILPDNGASSIVSLLNNTNITIQKVYYTSDVILSIMAGNITGNMVLNSNDINYIENYINLTPPFPATSSPGNRVGTTFNAVRLTVEKYVDRADDFPSTGNNRATTIHIEPDIFLDGYGQFAGQNVQLTPLPFEVVEQLVWDRSNIVVNSNPRLVSVAYTNQTGYSDPSCEITKQLSQSFPETPSFDPGTNNVFIPNNLIINDGGRILGTDGYGYRIDYEIANIVLEIPTVNFDQEYTMNLLTDLVADYSGNGTTRIGYPCLKFSDCTNVSLSGLVNNQVRFDVSIQSFSPNLNGLSGGIDGYQDCLTGIVVDGKIGVNIDYSTGMLTLNFSNLYQDPVLQTLNTKVQVIVFLKRAGFNNKPLFISGQRVQNILGVPTPTPPSIVCADPTVIVAS